MPSIPQSLLWISLVVLWLFVLVPMLISKRDAVRRTSDVALATRVLNSAGGSRLLRRGGPATGHRSDPHWRPSEDEDDDIDDANLDEMAAGDKKRPNKPTRSVVVIAAVVEDAEPDYLDVDVVDEDSGALPVGSLAAGGQLPLMEDDEDTADSVIEDAVVGEDLTDDEDVAADWTGPVESADSPDGSTDEYEYVDDTSGLEPPADIESRAAESPNAARRRRYDSTTAAAVSARKYKFRKRVLTVMALILVASAAAAFTVAPAVWWVCGCAGGVTVLYLGYLRRQTRIEARLRRRRMQRMARSRLGVENTDDREFEVVPSRLRRPGAVVLEIDDEDPIFEHLDYGSLVREYDLPRAAGQ